MLFLYYCNNVKIIKLVSGQISDAVGARTEIKYDALDRQQEITEPDGTKTKLEYDKAGNLVSVTDALGNIANRDTTLKVLQAHLATAKE